MPGEPSVVADCQCVTGEGPIYDPDAGLLYWVDIPAGDLYSYDVETGSSQHRLGRDGAIGGVALEADGALLLFEERGRIERFDVRTGDARTVVRSIDGEGDSRFNDVIADPEGRVFCGTMPTDERDGRLYRLDTDGSLETLREDVALPNGLGFTPDTSGLYFTESTAKIITRYEYDRATGALSGGDVIVDSSGEPGVPDGLTVDSAGSIWSARWDGGVLQGYTPTGEKHTELSFPARKVSAVTFGGPDFGTAYVTTALGAAPASGDAEPGSREAEGAGAGALFAVDLGVAGVPEFRSRVGAGLD